MALLFCHPPALKLPMTSGGLLGFHRIQEGGRRPYAWATVQLSRCPARGAVLLCPRRETTCQRCSTGTRKVANSSSAAIEAPALRPGRGWFRKRREAEQSWRVWALRGNVRSEPSLWLQLLAPETGARVSRPPLSFIEDLKAALGAPESRRHSLPSFLRSISFQCLSSYHFARVGAGWTRQTLSLSLRYAKREPCLGKPTCRLEAGV